MGDQIFLNEKDIAARVGLPMRDWQAAALVLERSGLPQRDPLFLNKRCWPAVEAFLIERARPKSKLSCEEGAYKAFNCGRARGSTNGK